MITKIEIPATVQEGTTTPTQMDTTGIKAKFDRQLHALRSECSQQVRAENTARAWDYLNLAKILLWWTEVQKHPSVKELYDYDENPLRRPVQKVDAGTNFITPLRHVYAGYLIVDSSFVYRKNKVLNKLDQELKANPDAYQVETSEAAQRLQKFLLMEAKAKREATKTVRDMTVGSAVAQANAVIAMAALEEQQDSESNETQVGQQVTLSANAQKSLAGEQTNTWSFTRAQRQLHLEEKALQYFSNDVQDGNKFQSTYNLLPTEALMLNSTDKKRKQPSLGMALIAQNSTGGYVVDAVSAISNATFDKFIKNSLVDAYCKKFAALPNSLRCILETVRSQMLMVRQPIEARVSDGNSDKQATVADIYQSRRHRLMYRVDKGVFLFSQRSRKDGVVTVAKPKTQVLEQPPTDVVMVPLLFKKLIKVLHNDSIHMYDVGNSDVIPFFTGYGDYKNATTLTSKTNHNHKLPLEFWSVANRPNDNFSQVDFEEQHFQSNAKWVLGISFVMHFARDAVDSWLEKFGSKLFQRRHDVIQFVISSNGFELDYSPKNGVFTEHLIFDFPEPIQDQKSFSGTFLAHELLAVFSAIGALDIISDVELQASDDSLFIRYETNAASYSVFVPTRMVSEKITPAVTQGFQNYAPNYPAIQWTAQDLAEIDHEEPYNQ